MRDRLVTSPLKMQFVDPVEGAGAIVLERIKDTPDPAYCVHGRTKCVSCGQWCLLGDASLKAVSTGTMPICTVCAKKLCSPDKLIGHVTDSDHR